jgi:outer membrane immunogenic protein
MNAAPAAKCGAILACALFSSALVTAEAAIANTAAPIYQPAPVYNWNGFYIGGHAGYGWGDIKNVFQPNAGNAGFFAPSTGATINTSLSSAAFGGHVGYNYQVGKSLLGLETAFTTGADKELAGVFPGVASAAGYRFDLDWVLAVTPRLGVAWHHWLAYVKAGVAVGRVNTRYTAPGAAPGKQEFSETATHVGPAIGLGIEYAFAPNWSIGLDYTYYGFGNQRYGSPLVDIFGGTSYVDTTVDLTYQTLLARLSYRPAASGPTYVSGAMNAAPRNAMWSGPYAGAHLGWGRTHADYAFAAEPSAGGSFGFLAGGGFTDKPDGLLAGIQIGYGQQSGHVVVGLEAMASAGRLKSSSHERATSADAHSATFDTRLSWIAAVTPRIGLANRDWHIYAKAGAAVAHAQTSMRGVTSNMGAFSFPQFAESAYHFGWTAGGGIEYALTPNWVVGVDVAYYDFGSAHYGGMLGSVTSYSLDLKGSTVLARFSYNLAPPPP